MPQDLLDHTYQVFDKMDVDGNGAISIKEAESYFKGFGKVSAMALFAAIDSDDSGHIDRDEWAQYFKDLYESGIYEHDEIVEEIDGMLEGEPFSLQARQMNENLRAAAADPRGNAGGSGGRGRRGSRELTNPVMMPNASKDLRNDRRSMKTDLALDLVDKAPAEGETRGAKRKVDRAATLEWG
jgi:hypothetical protein